MIGPADVVYLSGPISSDPDYRAKFARAERKIRKIAPECRIVNPAKGPENLSYLEYMQRDLALIERCTVVVMLPGHTRSPGAGMEKLYAARQGKRICRLNDLPDEAKRHQRKHEST